MVVLVLASPLWFPWALRPAAKSLGLKYSGYERNGYGRFSLTNVTLPTKAGEFHANHIEAFVPTAWLWHLLARGKARPFLKINGWNFAAQSSSNQTAAAASVYTNVTQLESKLETLAKWVPQVELTNGTLRANGSTIFLPQAEWANGNLSARIIFPNDHSFAVKATRNSTSPWKISVRADALDFHGELSMQKTHSALRAAGTFFWLSNRIELAAEFSRAGTLPQTARLTADSFDLPASLFRLNQYSHVIGALDATWNTNRFALNLRAQAATGSPDLPPLDFEARASGDTNSALIEVFKVSAPGLLASFSERTQIQFQPPFLTQPAALNLSMDLARQQWFPGIGTLQGNAALFPVENKFPRITFQLTGNGVTVSNLETQTIALKGEFNWPQLTLTSAQMVARDGSEASLTGTLNVADKTVQDGTMNYTGTFGSKLLPTGYSFDHATARAQFSGPLSALTHSARVEIAGVKISKSKPMQLNANWSGDGRNLNQINLVLKAGDSSLTFVGALQAGGATNDATISNLQLHTVAGADWQLSQPFHAAFNKLRSVATTNVWSLELAPVAWNSEHGSMTAEANIVWPERGNFRLAAQNLTTGLLKDFFSLTNFDGTLNNFTLQGGWTNGPMVFDLAAEATAKTGPPSEWLAQVSASGNDQGIVIRQLSVSSATQNVVRAQGNLPVFFRPASAGEIVQINTRAPLQFQAFTETNSLLWDELARLSSVQLLQPELRCDLTGTWENPQGRLTLTARKIYFAQTNRPLPEIENLNFQLDAQRNDSAVSKLTALVAGQPVSASAQVPVGREFWSALLRRRALPDWREVTAQLKMENAQLAAFARLTPEILTPQGEANVDIRLEHGELRGEVSITNAATRPLAALGPVREIQGRLVLSGHTVTLTRLNIEIGGQSLTAEGSAELNENPWQQKTIPPFHIHAYGTNLPLVRQDGVVIRADLNLAITNSAPANTLITGTVRLRDSFFLKSLQDLVPGRTVAPERRPPYFSIVAEPMAQWRLALRVEGDRFLKVQSPVFRGTVSTSTRLEGTLKEPLALGEVRVNSGAVTFPFGRLELKQGFVSLTSDNPFHPQLFVTAAAQRMGYDIKMEAT
ncbi:MAG: translocation and assembly module TamB, partial [Verrucomicrobiota bacterium]